MLYHVRKLRRFITPEYEYRIRRAAYSFLPAQKASVDAVFHCCAWKTGSQWIRLILSDPRFYMATGLKPLAIFNPPEIDADPTKLIVPDKRIVTNFFAYYSTYNEVQKPENHRVFYVVRNPRDLLVSWYFSNRYSHRPTPEIDGWRKDMMGMDDEQGLICTIGLFHEVRDRVKSWVDASLTNPNLVIVKFEDLTGENQQEAWRELLDHVGLESVSSNLLQQLLEFYHVSKLTPPVKEGADTQFEKYGNAGKPRRANITTKVENVLTKRYPNLLKDFGYGE